MPFEVWRATEWMRKEMLKTKRQDRQYMVEILYQELKKKYNGKTTNVDKTVMCIMMLFADRLITAHEDQSQNPNHELIRRIIMVVCTKIKDDTELKKSLALMLAEMDKAGTENEEKGRMIPWGLDILADDPDWSIQLKAVFKKYADMADPLIQGHLLVYFGALWDELAEDSQFAAEMKTSTLGQNFNLQLLFNVYGLLHPNFYNTKVGIATIAKTVGANPNARGVNKHYSRGYFTPHEVERFDHAIKSQQLLDHIKGIIQKHYNHKSV